MELLSAILIYLIVTKVYENMDLESQDPRFNTILGDQVFCAFKKKLKGS